jgi:hypothetical protein
VGAPVIDRACLEKLLHLSPRQALRVLSRFPASYAAGKSLLISRTGLVSALQAVLDGEDVQREQRRRQRLREVLEADQRQLRARRISIRAAPDVRDRFLPDLPAGIHLGPGELRIEFHGAEDLLRHLLELSQAIMNDYRTFENAVKGA